MVLILLPVNLVSQIKILPEKVSTYGNKKHTSRDDLYFSLKDNENNIYLIGTVENDFTFNDVKIIKLDSELNVLWEKELSFEFKLSYDGVADTFIDTNNDLILVCKAAFTSTKQTIILIKYSKNGEKMWDYPMSDLNNPVDYDFSMYFSFLDSNNNLHITYRPKDQNYLKYHFLTFSGSGEKMEDFTRDDLFRDKDHGYVYNNQITYINGVYNMIYKIELDVSPYQKFKLLRFNKDINELFDIEMDEETTNFINTPFAETYTTLNGDKNGDLVFIIPYYTIQKDYMVIFFNTDGSIKKTLQPDSVKDRFMIGHTFDDQNNLIIISNNKTSNTNENLVLSIQKYNSQGELIYEKSDMNYIGKISYFFENHISIYSDTGKIIKYDYNFNRLNVIDIEPINTYNFSINSILSIGDNSFLTGTTFDKKYPDSDYLSERNYLVRKTNNLKEIDAYTFSALGTSNAYKPESLHMVDGNYVYSLSEKLGPENFLDPYGSNAPEQKYFLTYDKDLNLIKEEEVDDNTYIFEDVDEIPVMDYYFTTSSGIIYNYKIEDDYKRISFYENDVYKWTRELTLSGIYELAVAFAVDKQGNFILSSSNDDNYEKIHRITPLNNYEFTEIEFGITHIVPLTNNWFFTVDYDGIIRILSNDFSIINTGPVSFDPIDSHFIEKNNKIIDWINGENNIWILNQFGEIEQQYYFDMVFNTGYYMYDKNNLINIKTIGGYIDNVLTYRWVRSTIEKFNLDLSYLIKDIIPNDEDNDGIDDSIDQCRNTVEGEVVNQYGCSDSQTLSVANYDSFDSEVNLYPNPSTGSVYLESLDINKIKSIRIFDSLGKEILSFNNIQKIMNSDIDLSQLSSGVYYIKIFYENRTYSTKKLIIE